MAVVVDFHNTAVANLSLGAAALALIDDTTNDVLTTRHGFAPKLPNDATKFFNGVGGYTVPPAGVGGELAYMEYTGDVSITATTEGTANTVVTAGAFTADGSSAYMVEFFAVGARPDIAVANRSLVFALYLDGSSIGRIGIVNSQATNPATQPVVVRRRLILASGSRTFSVRGFVSAGTGLVSASTGGVGNNVPGYVRVTKAT